jgi:hypothetical protein
MARTWDAFLSYSRSASGSLAVALERGIEQFARPWNHLRACNVFRDDSSMSANPALWGTIESALRDAGHLILLVTPDAASSLYVDREVGWWVENKGVTGILLVVQQGALVWDATSGAFTPDSPIPPSLRTAYLEEPRWVDATWFAAETTDPTTSPGFQDLVADLAAPIRGIPRDELIGEDVAQHRKMRRLTRGAIAALTILLIAAIGAAVIALIQRTEVARQSEEIAKQATSIAARQLSAVASGLLPTDLRLGSLLAAEGLQLEDSSLARTVLLEASVSSPNLDHFVTFPSDITAVAPDGGSTIAVGTQDGTVFTIGTAAGQAPAKRIDLNEPVERVAIAASADVVIARGQSTIGVAQGTADPVYIHMPEGSDLWAIAVSPGGDTWALSATAYQDSGPSSAIEVYTTGRTDPDATLDDPVFSAGGDYQHSTQDMSFVDDTTLRVMSLRSTWTTIDLSDETSAENWSVPLLPWSDLTNTTPSLDVVIRTAQSDASLVEIWPTAEAPEVDAPLFAQVALAAPGWLTVSPDQAKLLAVDSTGVYLVPVEGSGGTGGVGRLLSGVVDVTDGAFLADSERFVLAADDALSVWHVQSLGRAVASGGIRALDECSSIPYYEDCRASALGVSPTGQRMFTFDYKSWTLEVLAVPGSSAEGAPVLWTLPGDDFGLEDKAWLFDIPPILLVWLDDATPITIWPGQAPDASQVPEGVVAWGLGLPRGEEDAIDILDARMNADESVAVAASDGRVFIRNAANGEAVDSIELGPPTGERGYGRGRFSTDGATITLTDYGEYDPATSTSGPDVVRVFDISTQDMITELEVPAGMLLVDAMVVSGKLVVAFNSGPVWLVDVTGTGGTRMVSSPAAMVLGGNQSSRLVVRDDGIVGIPTSNGLELVDVATAARVNSIPLPDGFEGAMRAYAFEADGDALITTLYGGSTETTIATRLELDPAAQVALACATAGSVVTAEEWETLIGVLAPADPACE